MYLANTAAFNTVPYPVTAGEFIVAGFSSAVDGGGGTFIWVANPNPSTPFYVDYGVTFPHSGDLPNPPGTSGYFKRIYSGPINVRWFGATGDGINDDTNAVHAARDSEEFANNGTLYFPTGIYVGAFIFDYASGSRDSINIIGDGQGSVLMSNASGDPVVVLGYKIPTWKYARLCCNRKLKLHRRHWRHGF